MIESIVEQIYHQPCWLLQQGHGSFLTFEFGQPHLEIREPKPPKLANRRVTVHGDWHLWIYCCSWDLHLNDKIAAHSESSRSRIKRALEQLEGQKIVKVEIDDMTSDTVFHFDLGGLLKTRMYDNGLHELWMLYGPKGNVLSVRNDGKYSYQPRDTPEEDMHWEAIKAGDEGAI